MEQEIAKIMQNLDVTQNKQKIRVDKNRVHTKFSTRDHVFLGVRPEKIPLKLGSCAQVASRYYGPFEVLDRIGPDAYRLAFPINIRAQNVFHVSLLKKYVQDPNRVID